MTDLHIYTDKMTDFLIGLLETPSPTGYTVEAIAYVQKAFEALQLPGVTWSWTRKGALVGRWQGTARTAPRGVSAHVDTLGLMVREIKSDGRLRVSNIGGIVWANLEGEGVTVRTHEDHRFRGTMQSENPSSHVDRSVYTRERTADNMQIRLDAITRNADDTRALGVEVGDFVFVDARAEVTPTGFIRGRHIDDKAGVAAIYGALLALVDADLRPAQDTTFIISNYEEVGHGGSADWPGELAELLAIDMGAIGEGQNSDEYSVSICVKDGGGPYHYAMNNKLRTLAVVNKIPYNTDIYIHYASDGTAYWRAGGAARVGLIGPGVDASHSYERTHQDSLRHTAHLIAQYLLDTSI